MKQVIIILIFALSGCAQLMNGQVQPVVMKDYKQKIMLTTCSGSAEHWGNCNSKAMAKCTDGYSVLEKTENPNGGIRTLTFQCKK
ncbi:hypothetical protein MCETALH18_01193 [Methylophilaceae bacterium]